ncbi:Predicted flavin-nucleotide-binding protein [uncultured Eubacterium sp.]|nr:Predicted flavin-nucleotide-binding protein [uncultured Eubacterium sp.]
MFRNMRRSKQVLSQADSIAILERATSGVLAVAGDDDYPYAVPISFVYADGKIFFHCAKSGHKLDAIARNNKVSFCIIDEDQIVPEEYTTYFRSVIAFGKARILEEEGEKRSAIEKLAAKYSPNQEEGRLKEIDDQISHMCMVEITVDHLSGKEAIEFVKAKQNQ